MPPEQLADSGRVEPLDVQLRPGRTVVAADVETVGRQDLGGPTDVDGLTRTYDRAWSAMNSCIEQSARIEP